MKTLYSLQEHNTEVELAGASRWMVSYADFITLLFVLFMALYVLLNKEVQIEGKTPEQIIPEQVESSRQVLTARIAESLGAFPEVSLLQTAEGVVVEIGEAALFGSGSAVPASRAHALLTQIAHLLAQERFHIRVEGHTDDLPIQTSLYPSNWELSAARAAYVVRALAEAGVRAESLSAIGLANTRPAVENTTAENRAKNRRVNLVLTGT